MRSTQEQFDAVVTRAGGSLRGGEVLLSRIEGEDSDFVRFNGDAVRQAGSVHQRELHLDLVDGARHLATSLTLSGDVGLDGARAVAAIDELREQLRLVPADPHLLYATDEPSTERVAPGDLPLATDAVDRVLGAASGRDLAGVYAAGSTFHGFASSLGLRHWHESATFNLDWSFYLHADKAVKNLYAGTAWDDDAFARKVEWSARQLEALARPAVDLRPGAYRTYLAPAALLELVDMLSWGGFGLKSHRTKQTPLLRMVTEGEQLHPDLRLAEDIAGGTAPAFQAQGFTKPDEVVLIDGGTYAGHLVSPRSSREYGVATNGAEPQEFPVALSVAPGGVPAESVLERLGSGLYVGNLWYLNFSDRAACRTTGMTRFGTFWVEGGEIVAPVNVLRFDDTAYHLLGSRLEGLTDVAESILDPGTYGQRSTSSSRLPGALVAEMTFTL